MSQKLHCAASPHFQSALLQRGLISAKILEGIQCFPFREARRRKSPIYEILLAELYEEGCLITAKYFRYLTEKETRLMASNLINSTLKDRYPKLLIKLFENVKMAETTARVDSKCGAVSCLQILYESLVALERYEYDLNWLLEDIFRIIIDIIENILRFRCNGRCSPIIARIYCKYAAFLTKKERNIPLAVEYFKKSLELCRGQLWPAEDLSQTNITLHHYSAVQLTKALIAHARLVEEPITGMKFTRNALATLAEINYMKPTALFGEVMLLNIQYYMDMQQYRKARSSILLMQRHLYNIEGPDNVRLTCELYLKEGSCYSFMQQTCKALIKYKQCRLLAFKFDLKNLTGRALLKLGELYEKYPSQHDQARQCFEEAKTYFNDAFNKEMKQVTIYALARITAKEHFSQLMRTIKKSAHNKCATLRLYLWKDRLKPLRLEKPNSGFFVGDNDLPECEVAAISDVEKAGNGENPHPQVEDMDLVECGAGTIPDDTLIEYASHFITNSRLARKRSI